MKITIKEKHKRKLDTENEKRKLLFILNQIKIQEKHKIKVSASLEEQNIRMEGKKKKKLRKCLLKSRKENS